MSYGSLTYMFYISIYLFFLWFFFFLISLFLRLFWRWELTFFWDLKNPVRKDLKLRLWNMEGLSSQYDTFLFFCCLIKDILLTKLQLSFHSSSFFSPSDFKHCLRYFNLPGLMIPGRHLTYPGFSYRKNLFSLFSYLSLSYLLTVPYFIRRFTYFMPLALLFRPNSTWQQERLMRVLFFNGYFGQFIPTDSPFGHHATSCSAKPSRGSGMFKRRPLGVYCNPNSIWLASLWIFYAYWTFGWNTVLLLLLHSRGT